MLSYTSLTSVDSSNSRTASSLLSAREHLPPIKSAGLMIRDNRLPSPESPHLIHFNKHFNGSNRSHPSVAAAAAATSAHTAPPPFLEPAPLTEESGIFQIKSFALDLLTMRLPAALCSNFCFTESITPRTLSRTAASLPLPHVHTFSNQSPTATVQTTLNTPDRPLCTYVEQLQTAGESVKMNTAKASVAILPLLTSNTSNSNGGRAASSSVSPIMAAACTSAAAAAAEHHPNSNLSFQFLNPSSGHVKRDNELSMLFSNEPHPPFEQQPTNITDDDTSSIENSTITAQQNEKEQQQKQPSLNSVNHTIFLRKDAHIKRPRNAWIHFRCHYGQALKSLDPTLRAEEVSKRASLRWSLLSRDEKKPWHGLAEQEKLAHREAFPEYRYSPRRPTTLTSGFATASSATSTPTSSFASSSPSFSARRHQTSRFPYAPTKKKNNKNKKSSGLRRNGHQAVKQTRQSSGQ